MKKIIFIIIIILVLCFSLNDKKINLRFDTKIIKDTNWFIDIPKISLYEKFYDNDEVDNNIIIIKPSEYPIKNNSTMILAGHSGNGDKAYFKNLYKLKLNDFIYLRNNNRVYKYKIVNIYYQEKNGSINIYKDNDKTNLILVTCTKNDHNSQTVYVSELLQIKKN